MKKRVVITGMGIISPLGTDKEGFWQALTAGESGIRCISRFDASTYPCQIAGEVDDTVIGEFMTPQEVRRTSRFIQFVLAASSLATQDAQLSPEQLAQPTTGVIMGTSMGSIATIEQQTLIAYERGIRRIHPFSAFLGPAHSAASYVNIKLGIPGPALTISTGCAGGTDAIGHAFNQV